MTHIFWIENSTAGKAKHCHESASSSYHSSGVDINFVMQKSHLTPNLA